MVNQAVGRIQSDRLNVGKRVAQNIRQTLIAVGDAGRFSVVNKKNSRTVLNNFVERNRRKVYAEFAQRGMRYGIFLTVFLQDDLLPVVRGRVSTKFIG